MAKKKPHSATPALKILEDAGISHEVHTFSAGSDHFGEHAVAELGTDPERVFKTLVVDLSAGSNISTVAEKGSRSSWCYKSHHGGSA